MNTRDTKAERQDFYRRIEPLELGPKEGATLLCGGLDPPQLPDRVRNGNYVMPTVFADRQRWVSPDRQLSHSPQRSATGSTATGVPSSSHPAISWPSVTRSRR